MKKIITCFIIALLCFVLVGCNEQGETTKKSLKISGATTVEVGKQIKFEIEATGVENPEYLWIVSDENFGKIEDGVFTALKAGSVTIALLESNTGLQDTIDVMITDVIANTKNLSIVGESTGKVGGIITLTASYDLGASVNLQWSSSDESIATVENGTVNCLAKGTVTITLKDTVSGLSKEFVLLVKSDVVTIDDMLDWAFEQTGSEALDDIDFPVKNDETGATFEWSTDSDLIDIACGCVELIKVDEVVKLTCTAKFNGETKSRTIDFTVLGYAAYDVYEEFMKQFKGNQIFNDMVDMETVYSLYGGSTVRLESHNQDIFTNDGKLTKSFYDEKVDVTLHITLTNPAYSKDINVTLTAKALEGSERKELVKNWIERNITPDGYIYKTTVLPNHIDDYDVDLEWLKASGGELDLNFSVDNPILGDDLGVVVKMVCKDNTKYTLDMSFKVALSPITDPWQKIELFVNTISQSEVSAFSYLLINWNGYSNGYVPFVTEAPLDIIQDILSYTDGKNRTGITKTSTEYVVVHDTGSPSQGADATMHNNYIKNLNYSSDPDKRVVSWHFTIDDKLCYQHLPLDEVAWHAGDGSHRFGDIYTNSTYKKTDCIGGGNYNGIGIESCVNKGTDYSYTMRRLAKLVATMLVKYNLGVDRVKQHWHFSGKNCPQVMRDNKRWDEFMYLVKLEYYCMTELKGVSFEWTSLTPDIMDNEGRILDKQPNNTTVSYKVKATLNGTSKEYTFSSVLKLK